ncbi:MAG: SBBP repeat-containing protein [Bacteroidetes bacterium]|nr:SBBP repeat-containing protein [Bacteroidota bacterium]
MRKILLVLALLSGVANTGRAQNYRMWATYYGGSDSEFGNSVTTDAAGNVYVAGWTYSTSNISTAGSYQPVFGGSTDAYLVKFNGAGVRLWATYYGGTDADYGYGVKTDAAGNVYLAGYTFSTSGIATAGSFQPSLNGVADAFLVKFDSNGNRIWGTYYGGADFDQGVDLATDATGNVYMTGYTISTTDISSAGSYQTTNGGLADAFLVKFNGSGNRLWGTYYGGTDQDLSNDVATDTAGNVFIGGYTMSTSAIASAGGFQNSFGGNQDAFIAKFDPSGNRLWATYYGGSDLEYGFGIATGPGGCVYLAGITNSTSGIASGGFQNTFGGWSDSYLVKFDASGNRLWGTYYGGANAEEGNDVATDAWGNVFLVGDVYSPNAGNCIATPGGFQNNLIGTENHFLAAFTSNGLRTCATYYGQLHEEEARITVNAFGDLYMAGTVKSTTGIASGGFQNTFGGGMWDASLVKFSASVPRPEVITNVPDLPPIITSSPSWPPKKYYSIGLYDAGSISLSNCVLKNFSGSAPPPASGSSIVTFTGDFTAMLSNSGSPVPVSCTATARMKMTFVSSSGSSAFYETEMLQLDLSGGSFPSGVLLRESPTLFSTGLARITNAGGGIYRISSFFDVFMELSTDSGNSWQPTSKGAALMELQDDVVNPIPALGTWAMILFAGIVLMTGLFFQKRT